jgi:hypothetical protein
MLGTKMRKTKKSSHASPLYAAISVLVDSTGVLARSGLGVASATASIRWREAASAWSGLGDSRFLKPTLRIVHRHFCASS